MTDLPTSLGRRVFGNALRALFWLLCVPLTHFAFGSVRVMSWAHAALPSMPSERLQWLLQIASYAVPLACFLVSMRRAWKAVVATGIGDPTQPDRRADWLHSLGWLQFEQLVESHFANQGYRIALLHSLPSVPARVSAVDANGAILLIHYTEWKTNELGFEIVRAFADEIAARSLQGGVLLTFGKLTRAAATFASSHKIEVISGDRLKEVLRSSEWDTSRFKESRFGTSNGFGNSHLPKPPNSR